MEIIIAVILWGIAWGIVINKVLRNKGYNENWFWWGFFFGWFALIVAVTKPNNNSYRNSSSSNNSSALNSYAEEKKNSDIIKNGGWKCICGTINPGYLTTCKCGETPQSIKEKAAAKEKEKMRKKESEDLDILKNLKYLLDSGVITQEEFDEKKKRLLCL